MRWVGGILVILAMASPALAADYDLPILRGSSQPAAPVVSVGPATFTRWSGFYFGGNVSLGSATSDFSTATRPLVASSLQHTTIEDQAHPSDFQVLGRGSAVAAGGGAFLGYNTQWQDLVLGVEATYTHTNLNTTASSTAVARVFPSLNTAAAVFGNGNLNLTDFGTARGRAMSSAISCHTASSAWPWGERAIACPRLLTWRRPQALQIRMCRALTLVEQRRHANLSRFSTVPDKATPCSGATRSAPDLIGRSRRTSSRVANSSSCNSRRFPTSRSRWPAAASAPASSSKSG
jgi:hypothetical protein